MDFFCLLCQNLRISEKKSKNLGFIRLKSQLFGFCKVKLVKNSSLSKKRSKKWVF